MHLNQMGPVWKTFLKSNIFLDNFCFFSNETKVVRIGLKRID